MRLLACLTLFMALGCGGNDDGAVATDADVDTDSDTGSDSDTDTDTDSGTGTGTETWTGSGTGPINDCFAPLTPCGGACVFLDSDLANCGGCDNPCGGETPYCVDGACAASCPYVECGEVCADTEFNPLHCDTCDTACDPGLECRHGGCR